jgi:hypothetical protein
MRLRARHFASFLLLLASLGAAEGATLRDGTPAFGAHYVAVLLAQQEAAAAAQSGLAAISATSVPIALKTSEQARINSIWTMRPSAAHSIGVHAVTGSSL